MRCYTISRHQGKYKWANNFENQNHKETLRFFFSGIATGLFCVSLCACKTDRYTNVNQESKIQTKIYSSTESNKRQIMKRKGKK